MTTERKITEKVRRILSKELEQQVQERTALLTAEICELRQTLAAQQHIIEALQESEERFRLMADHAPVLIWMADSTGQCTFFNRPWLAFRGRALEHEQGTGWLEGIHPDDQASSLEAYRAAFAARQPFQATYRLRRADGVYRWLLESAVPRHTPGGAFAGYIGSCVDITDRKQAADALRAADVRLRSHMENSPLAVIEWDQELRVAQWSARAEQIFGWSAAEVLGKRRHEWRLVVEGDDARIQAAIKPFLATASLQPGVPWEVHENRNYTKDGRIIQCEWYNSFLYDEAGRFTSILSLVHDVTARKQAEERLARYTEDLRGTNDELREFAYAASHDLREPLRQISVYLQLLAAAARDRLDAEAHQYIDYGIQGAQRMQALVHDLMTYVQISQKEGEPPLLDCDAVLRQTLQSLQAAIAESRAEITLTPLPAVRAHEVHLTQLLQNLLSNALKYRGEHTPRIKVSASRHEGTWVFAVRDNGIGIDPQYHTQIFGLFKRLHGQEYAGTGLGLAICAKIVERYGGRIWVESYPGQGATFLFTLGQES
jgi:two-component system, chemotaxis family, CheB/CheR fusion protein